MRFILGPIIIAIGILVMKYSVPLANFTGMVDFAEKYLTGGLAGTYTLYKIIGLILCILGLCYLFGLFHFIPGSVPEITAPSAEGYSSLKFLI